MAYTPTVWKNGEFPPIDAEHLNKIEQGIAHSAPGGFGLGGASKLLSAADDLNNIRITGWYVWAYTSPPQNAPDNNWGKYGCSMYVVATEPNGYAIQTVYDLSDDITHGCAIQRTICPSTSGNIYYPWEWINPPMLLGTEYRTTERYLGKLVYVKTINMGNLPGNAVKQARFQSNNVVDKIVSVTGQCTTDSGVNLSLPCHAGSGPNWNTVVLIDATGAGAAQIVTFAEDLAGYTDACITVKYTKLAD